MALDRLTQITSVGITSGITLQNINVIGVVTATTLSASEGITVTGVVTASSFVGNVTSDINPSSLNVTGVSTFQNDVRLGDNDNLYIGDGNDLRIFHDGSNSFIQDNGTGNLFIDSSNTYYRATSHLIQNSSSSENLAIFTSNGSVELYFDNAKEFETTGYGATVFGILQSQGFQSSGIATLGVTSATNFTAQQANISGLSTFSGGIQVGATTSITVGQSFIRNNQIGLGATTITGRNAGVGTATGTLIFNSSSNNVEYYTGTSWISLRSVVQVSGGTVSDARPGFKVHTFTSDGNFIISGGELNNVELLVVAGGGGGGGNQYGAGGGAGGVNYATGLTITAGTHPADIGPGGPGGANGGAPGGKGGDGTDSIFGPASPSPFYRIAKGGGAGGSGYTSPTNAPGNPGGSGGGASSLGGGATGGPATQPAQNPGKPGTNYGNVGGTYPNIPSGYAPAGGGGAGAAGVGNLGAISGGGNGGDGQPISITGSSVRYGAGGGASIFASPPFPATAVGRGGNGGGGNGAISQNGVSGSSPNINGVANTGSGGGGAHGSGGGPFNNSTTTGGAGGSGIIIVAYPTTDNTVNATPG
jgi:hypothetical protein